MENDFPSEKRRLNVGISFAFVQNLYYRLPLAHRVLELLVGSAWSPCEVDRFYLVLHKSHESESKTFGK